MDSIFDDRRTFLTNTGLGVAAMLSLASEAMAQGRGNTPSAEELANIKIVDDMIAAFVARDGDKLKAAYTDDSRFAVGAIGKLPPTRTPAGFDNSVKTYSKVEMKIIRSVAMGPVVMHERYDRTTRPDRTGRGHYIGIFTIRNGQIVDFLDFSLNDKTPAEIDRIFD